MNLRDLMEAERDQDAPSDPVRWWMVPLILLALLVLAILELFDDR